MDDICKNSTYIVDGLDEFLFCSLENDKCFFQRYCPEKGRVINTEGAKTCKTRTKNVEAEHMPEVEVSENEVSKVKNEVASKPENKKEYGIVTLVTNTYVVYDCSENSRYKNGHFNVKIGDKIEL